MSGPVRGATGSWVGRDAELAVVRAAARDVAAGRGRVVIVEGEPGIGKSALVRRVLADATALGCRVRCATADPLTARIPLQVVSDLLGKRGNATDSLPWALGDPVAARTEQLLSRVDELSATAPTVLALDDLQWLDEDGLVLWSRMLAATSQAALLLVATCRPLPRSPALTHLLRSVRAGAGTVIDLGPLSDDDAADLAGRLSGGAAGPGLRERIAAAGGNPLYVEETVGALARQGGLTVADGTVDVAGPPPTVTLPGVIADRLDFLTADTREMLRLAALLDQDITVADLTALTGRTAVEIVPLVDEALTARVLLVDGERLAFRHGLVRDSLLASIPAPLRPALRRETARALATAGAPPERVAAQLLGTRVEGDVWTAQWLAGLGGLLDVHLPTVVEELLGRVLAAPVADLAVREELQAQLVTSAFRRRAFEVVQDVAPGLLGGAPAPERAAQVTWLLGYAHGSQGRTDEALRLVAGAVAHAPRPWATRLRALHALLLYTAGAMTSAAQLAEEVRAAAPGAADPMATGYACHVLSLLALHECRTLRALAHVDEALDAVDGHRDLVSLRIMLLANRANWSERVADAEVALGAARRLYAQFGAPQHQDLACAAGFLYHSGRWDDAQVELAGMFADERVGTAMDADAMRGIAALIAARRGAVTAATELVNGPTSSLNRANIMYMILARAVLAERAGDAEQAARLLAGRLDDPELAGHRHLWIARAVRTARAAGDTALAVRAAAVATADAAAEPEGIRGAAARWAGALVSGDLRAFGACVEHYRDAGFLPLLADVLADAALAAAAAGDPAAARRWMNEAAVRYADLGAEWEIRRADARLRALGVRRRARTTAPRPATGWGALTPTEARVAGLVVEGRSNPAIATVLFLSRRTVQTHVSSILAKLGVESRHEVARLAPNRAGSAAVR